jgi:phosphoglycolate phosphatase
LGQCERSSPEEASEAVAAIIELAAAAAEAAREAARATRRGEHVHAEDAEAARDAGMPCILATFGYTPVPVEELGGDVLIDAFAVVVDAIAGLRADHSVRRALG